MKRSLKKLITLFIFSFFLLPLFLVMKNKAIVSQHKDLNVRRLNQTLVKNKTTYSKNIYLKNLTKLEMELELQTGNFYNTSAVCSCQSGKVFLLILVCSSPQNIDRRDLIRMTWASSYSKYAPLLEHSKSFQKGTTYSLENTLKVVFVLGRPQFNNSVTMETLSIESTRNKDLIIGNFTDSYRNLTRKTRFGFKWAHEKCPSRFIMKTDDDTFVNSVWLVEWLKGVAMEKLYTGLCDNDVHAIRNNTSKWYMSPVDYPATLYPHYCMGPGYIVSYDVLTDILSISYGRVLFPYEDVYVGMMVHELGIKARDERQHFYTYKYREVKDDCKLRNIFVIHEVPPVKLLELWMRVGKTLNKCNSGVPTSQSVPTG